MRKFLTIFTLSLLAVSCIDNDYDLSDIDTDDIGIGDENSVFTCPLMTLRVAVADIVNEQGDLDGILAEADVWLPNRLPDGADMPRFCQEAVKVHKVAVVPGNAFLTDEKEPCQAFRLNYSTPTDEEIVEGVKRLGALTRSMF